MDLYSFLMTLFYSILVSPPKSILFGTGLDVLIAVFEMGKVLAIGIPETTGSSRVKGRDFCGVDGTRARVKARGSFSRSVMIKMDACHGWVL